METNFVVTNNMLMMGLIGILIWIAKKYMQKLDDHVSKCDKRAVRNAARIQWIGDGMHAVAARTGAELPPRPTFEDEEEEVK